MGGHKHNVNGQQVWMVGSKQVRWCKDLECEQMVEVKEVQPVEVVEGELAKGEGGENGL